MLAAFLRPRSSGLVILILRDTAALQIDIAIANALPAALPRAVFSCKKNSEEDWERKVARKRRHEDREDPEDGPAKRNS